MRHQNEMTAASRRFLDSAHAHRNGSLALFYDEWLEYLRSHPHWDAGADDDLRVPLVKLSTRRGVPGFRVPDAAGIYLWGSDSTWTGRMSFVPRKVGQSGAPPWASRLRKRFGRYKTAGTKSRAPIANPPQALIAQLHWSEFRREAAQETRRFPQPSSYEELIKSVSRRIAGAPLPQPAPPSRWQGAADWALHARTSTLDDIWVAFLLVPDSHDSLRTLLNPLEERLQAVANVWNQQHEHLPPLIND